ncbi:MAG: DUF58 domain-containing protein [Bacteroidales bacterium]|nr:DUF58 domain-containing protein [Bacteroidales bacterium]
MKTSEFIAKKVRYLEIKTRKLTQEVLSGSYHSAFKGRGMMFSEVREYVFGDDVRNIDWNVTARFNHTYVKVFEEERELTVMLLIDFSNSNSFGSTSLAKKDMITEIAGTLAFSAMMNNDKVGAIFFTDKIEKYIPPKKGSKHVLRIIHDLLTFKPSSPGTNIDFALEKFNTALKRRCIAFVISDFLDLRYEKNLAIAEIKNDVVAIKISDPFEKEMIRKFNLLVKDPETGQLHFLASKERILDYLGWRDYCDKYFYTACHKHQVDYVEINTTEDYVKPLAVFFKKRGKKI